MSKKRGKKQRIPKKILNRCDSGIQKLLLLTDEEIIKAKNKYEKKIRKTCKQIEKISKKQYQLIIARYHQKTCRLQYRRLEQMIQSAIK